MPKKEWIPAIKRKIAARNSPSLQPDIVPDNVPLTRATAPTSPVTPRHPFIYHDPIYGRPDTLTRASGQPREAAHQDD